MILKELAEAVEKSDVTRINGMREAIAGFDDPWKMHLSLFPVVDRVLNPPFINPHLPKMHNICRDLAFHLSKEGLRSLVYLESMEYARRPKLDLPARQASSGSTVTFRDIEKSIAAKDTEKVALLSDTLVERHGLREFIRRLLLLASGYLGQSLGHSVSCTAFILLELLERPGATWPGLFLLADYFCKGGFSVTPPFNGEDRGLPLDDSLSRSVTGTGFVDLHHTITLFAIERTRSFFTPGEYLHMVRAWEAFMGDKEASPRSFAPGGKISDYAQFRDSFDRLDVDLMLDLTGEMLASPSDRSRLCAFLTAGVCDLYQGNYNPHFLTGLGSLLWLINTRHHDVALVQNGLYQYLGFYFKNMKSES